MQKIVALYYSYMETYDGVGSFSSNWIESDLFAQLWYLFLECQTKQHAARSCYIHESELPYKVELSKSYGSLHNRSTYNINTRLAFKQRLNVMVSFDFFDRQSNTQQDWVKNVRLFTGRSKM